MEWLLLAVLGLIAVWLFFTWYAADDEPVLGPASATRVTFKQVVIGALRDVREIILPNSVLLWVVCRARRFWIWAGPKVTNPTTWAALATNAAIYAPLILNDPTVAPLMQALLAKYPLIGLAAALLGLWATRAANAPDRIPAPGGVNPHGGPAAP